MQKRICLSEYEVRHFYATRREWACLDFGYPVKGQHPGCDREEPNGICSLCMRLAAFQILIEMEE